MSDEKKTGGPVPENGKLAPPRDAMRSRLPLDQRPKLEPVLPLDHPPQYEGVTVQLPPMVMPPRFRAMNWRQRLVLWLAARVGVPLAPPTESYERVNIALKNSWNTARDDFFKQHMSGGEDE